MPKTKTQKLIPPGSRSRCPIACALDLLGDKWSLLIIRDLTFRGMQQFGELQNAGEGISTNILTQRLAHLQEWGIVSKTPYQDNPVRYHYALTSRGAALKPVLLELIRWGNAHVKGTLVPEVS